MALVISTACSGRTKTSMSDAMRGPSESPPPTTTLRPTVPDGHHADRFEPAPDLGHVPDADPVQLHVLARREVAEALPEHRAGLGAPSELVGDLTDGAGLDGVESTAWNLDADHEGVPA